MIGPGHTTRTTRSRSVSVAPCFRSIARIVDVRIARIAFDAIVVTRVIVIVVVVVVGECGRARKPLRM